MRVSKFHLRLAAGIALAATLPVRATQPTSAPVQSAGLIAKGTDWATPYYVVDSAVPGPTVLVVGGMHGNEPAGAHAAEEIRYWTVSSGKLIVIPQANKAALALNARSQPATQEAGARDLNRCFPQREGQPPQGALAEGLWNFVRDNHPDWLIDLHEGVGLSGTSSKSVAASIIAGNAQKVRKQAAQMIQAVNETIGEEKAKFTPKVNPIGGSLARAAFDRLGVGSMIVETSRTDQALSLRIRQHRVVVHRLLADLKMDPCGVDVLVRKAAVAGKLRVAVYDAQGSLNADPRTVAGILGGQDDAVVRYVGPPEILNEALDQFDVLVMPGGSASEQSKALGEKGLSAIKKFVKEGGGYVGICAGAYLATGTYTWSLGILEADVIDRAHWRRGKGLVKVELTDQGRDILGNLSGQIDVRYANGPLLSPAKKDGAVKVLAHFRSEINQNNAPEGVMKDTPAVLAGQFGKGRVIVSSPHVESMPGLADAVRRAVRWAGGR